MAHVVLKGSGQKMPLIGLGLWKIPKDKTADATYKALKEGYRLLDGACDYGNEKEAGEGLARAIKDGVVKREDVFVTTKLWNAFHKKEHVHALARKQLADWGLEYFDLYLMHFPISLKYVDPAHRYPPEWFADDGKTVELQDTPIEETWRALEEVHDTGLAKNIGVSNTQSVLLQDIIRYARIQPAANQVEIHPYLSQEALVAFCKYHDIAVTAYTSFGPAGWKELDMHHEVPSLFQQEIVGKIAAAHKKTPAQVLLRWSTQRGIAVIPKSSDHQRLTENLKSDDFDLTAEELKEISSLNRNKRLNDPTDIHTKLTIFG